MTDDREMWYRVPRSAEECAVHLEAGGVVEVRRGHWVTLEGSGVRPADFRLPTVAFDANIYRLVYTSPVGMSPVIGAPGHAYGLAKDAPDGWGRRGWEHTDSWNVGVWEDDAIIEARPPAPAPEPRTEKVPLTKLAGRTLVGETERVGRLDPPYGAATWRWRPEWSTLWRLLTVDIETGMVEVLAEEEA